MPADDQSIAKLAYQLWESRGRPEGSGERDWLEAEAMLAASQRAAGSHPGPELRQVSQERPLPQERRKSRAKKNSTSRRDAAR